MSFIIGYFGAGFFLAYLIVHFFLKKRYFEKNNKVMDKGDVVIRVIGVGIVLNILALAGRGL
ncbi:MAG: hypothetical protein ACRC7N_17665 [Clostridium sp.]